MNRAEARRLHKETEKKATYNLTRDQIAGAVKNATEKMAEEAEKRIQEESKRSQSFAIETLIYASALVMYEEYGFKQKRVQKFVKRLEGIMQDFVGDRLTLDDIKGWCRDNKIEIEYGREMEK